MQRWHTLLELKEDHEQLGFKEWTYFIVDFPTSLRTGEMEYMIAQPTFAGLGVGVGVFTYVLTISEIHELFNEKKQTFDELSKEMEENYFKQD
ncbi:hypothetical protein PQE68_gp051 [Bacillus phage vB_BanS_Sophrita]|uniref:Uncharacterized protein n=1 Tax=Bacillus phage vB_BanS_Sophrita TaxID=2894790 RepID=A0AAE9CE78_9CAUD|nr:hypothetical protein PQE68_gp051 [Bacillus phage vB_BanS_Sophrita]UGO50642.1 hypothetical protein SOPHRITA_51 [Bacillus phage vB_BanS_Sophrita]